MCQLHFCVITLCLWYFLYTRWTRSLAGSQTPPPDWDRRGTRPAETPAARRWWRLERSSEPSTSRPPPAARLRPATPPSSAPCRPPRPLRSTASPRRTPGSHTAAVPCSSSTSSPSFGPWWCRWRSGPGPYPEPRPGPAACACGCLPGRRRWWVWAPREGTSPRPTPSCGGGGRLRSKSSVRLRAGGGEAVRGQRGGG